MREIRVNCKAKECYYDKLEGMFLIQKCMRCPNFVFKLNDRK